MTIQEKLLSIQSELKVPKSQMNKFGGYKFRSCEDILEALKPLLKNNKCVLTISDSIVDVGGRVYVRAQAQLQCIETPESLVCVEALAREAENKKGMDDAQITGSASSYARKYALNGLFAIDDTKDSDFTNNGSDNTKQVASRSTTTKPVNTEKPSVTTVMEALTECKTIKSVETVMQSASKYTWKEDELKQIKECENNVINILNTF